MRKVFTYSLLILILSMNQAALSGDLPGPFVAGYSLHSMGTRFANMKRTFTRQDNGKYIYLSETNTAGLFSLFRKDHIVEKSIWHLDGKQIQPLYYSYEHSGGGKDRNVNINFNWSTRKIINTVNGSSWQMPIQAYIMDKLLYQLAIMHDLKNGIKNISYTVADGGKIKTYDFVLVGEDFVETPIGNFKSLKLVRYKQNSKRKTTIWCAGELGYLPVKVDNIENSGRRTMAIIESLSGESFN